MRIRAPAFVDRLRSRVLAMIARAVVRSVSDGPGLQELRVALMGYTVARAERIQNYGLTSVPPVGSECAIVFAGGDWSRPMILAADDRASRPRAQADGVVILYDASGTRLTLSNDGRLRLEASSEVEVEAPSVKLTAASVTLEGSSQVALVSGSTSIALSPAGVVVSVPSTPGSFSVVGA